MKTNFKFSFLLSLLLLFCYSKTSRLKKTPDFVLEEINGEKFHLYEHIKNKVVIIDFWDTWCPPCRAEIPHFIEIYSDYEDKGVLIIGIAFAREGIERVKSFCEENGINYPVLVANREVVESYGGISAIPTTFIINKKGEIVEKIIGYRDKEFFEEKIKELLK
ncbi:MAG: TlpA disulfide reductase family protein [candidate division WOR-3 bacterium]|uniref:TlpA family protein disulfide reductase n=2 Tax=candidate division WOR-3 bacterium TaxID=2052148 RepID=A0A7V4E1U9_UNCW3